MECLSFKPHWNAYPWSKDYASIEAVNMDTDETLSLANGAGNYNPSIEGDLITWESEVTGNLDIWLYRRSTGETFQVTDEAQDQYLNDVFGDLLAYVDMSGGSEDIYVTKLNFIPDDPCADQGGDLDGDGWCQNNDNCPDISNAAQMDSDGDLVGDACDNCPDVYNPILACEDSSVSLGPSNACNIETGFCMAQNDNDDDQSGDECDDDDDNDGVDDSTDNCLLVANANQEDADQDGIGDACDDTFTTSYLLEHINEQVTTIVETITELNVNGGNGLITKLIQRKGKGDGSVVSIVESAVSDYEAGIIDVQTYLAALQSALDKLDAFDAQLAAKIGNGQIIGPEASQLVAASTEIRLTINAMIANAGP